MQILEKIRKGALKNMHINNVERIIAISLNQIWLCCSKKAMHTLYLFFFLSLNFLMVKQNVDIYKI